MHNLICFLQKKSCLYEMEACIPVDYNREETIRVKSVLMDHDGDVPELSKITQPPTTLAMYRSRVEYIDHMHIYRVSRGRLYERRGCRFWYIFPLLPQLQVPPKIRNKCATLPSRYPLIMYKSMYRVAFVSSRYSNIRYAIFDMSDLCVE